ncbi:MAG: aldehyde dehydrogenase, partial [Chloroflexi bacterium]|nr:aldehyde dehydrogenase [Chloroflexota bacterium]
MPYGWTGTNLEVDLTKGTVHKVKGDPALVRAYLGGKGIGLKILWDRVPPETGAFSPDNLIVISPGLLVGTSLPAANRCVMSFISPVSEHYHHSAMGGYFAPELKHAGYDNIIISGKSPTPVYLWINDDQVQLRDASHLWGHGTYDTRRIIRQELKNEEIEIACIGQAGENKLFQASVQGGIGSSAAMAGPGAVWGDKKLKAIAVYGTRDVVLANPAGFNQLSQCILDRTRENNYSTVGTNRLETRSVWYGYYNEQDYGQLPPNSELKKSIDKIEEKMDNLVKTRGTRVMSCHNCRAACITAFDCHGRPSYVKCTSFLIFLVYSKYIDYDWALDCYNMTEDWGLDIESFPLAVAFAIDLYQRGILTKEDTDGLHLEFGNPEVFTTLMKKIVNREGIGDVLANGILRAARQIGRGAEERVFVTKRREMRLTASHA